jgi:hypothetical protein
MANMEKIDATKHERLVCPLPGTHFLFRGDVVDLTSIPEKQALRLAADPACRFLKLKQSGSVIPETTVKAK